MTRFKSLGLVGPLLGGHMIRHSMRAMWPLLQSQTTLPLLEPPTLAPPGGVHHRFRLDEASHPLFRSKLVGADPPWLSRTDHKSLLMGRRGMPAKLAGGSQALHLAPDNSLCRRCTPNVLALSSTTFPCRTELSRVGASRSWEGRSK